jgi:hypothetical protein
MATEKQLAANRRNARRSTGPRSSAGKHRVSRNALRHGLSISVTANPAVAERIERLARAIAGGIVDEKRLNDARAVAAAEFDLARARQAKLALIERIKAFGTLDPPPGLNPIYLLRAVAAMAAGREPAPLPEPERVPAMPPNEPARTAEAVKRGLRELAKFDRYEQRARVRRDRAVLQMIEFGLYSTTSSNCAE